MIGIVVVGHGEMAGALVGAARLILKDPTPMRAVAVNPEEDEAALRARLKEAIAEVKAGKGVILFTDMLGGTASNVALSLLSEKGVEVVTGVNLPMLVKLPSVQKRTLREAAQFIRDYGAKNISLASKLLERPRPESPAG
ncbi:MAG: PTS sugar transporter subunit IIA [Nitrospinota bacterium]